MSSAEAADEWLGQSLTQCGGSVVQHKHCYSSVYGTNLVLVNRHVALI